jgi:hypothetical protein
MQKLGYPMDYFQPFFELFHTFDGGKAKFAVPAAASESSA